MYVQNNCTFKSSMSLSYLSIKWYFVSEIYVKLHNVTDRDNFDGPKFIFFPITALWNSWKGNVIQQIKIVVWLVAISTNPCKSYGQLSVDSVVHQQSLCCHPPPPPKKTKKSRKTWFILEITQNKMSRLFKHAVPKWTLCTVGLTPSNPKCELCLNS